MMLQISKTDEDEMLMAMMDLFKGLILNRRQKYRQISNVDRRSLMIDELTEEADEIFHEIDVSIWVMRRFVCL